jgi:hypothetical protein
MSFIQNLFTSRDNNANGANYVGQNSRIWWNPDTNAFYFSDGNTAGGILITGGGSGNGLPGGPANTVQYNAGSGTFGGDPNFTFDAANSTLTITNIVANTLTGGAGGSDTQVQFNNNGNFTGNSNFTYNSTTSAMLVNGTASLGNVFPVNNNVSNIGSDTQRFYGIWLGSGDINLIDDTLNINQQINAQNGNLVISGGNGLVFGQFAMYGNTISTINPTANINIGLAGSTGYVDIQRPIAVNSTGGGLPAFLVEQTGQTQIFAPGLSVGNSALDIIATTTRTQYAVTAPTGGSLLHATAAESSPGFITIDSFSNIAGAGGGFLVARRFRGNVASPAAVQAGDNMMLLGASGYNGSNIRSGVSSARITFVAAENFTGTSQSANIDFRNQVIGTGVDALSARINAGGLTLPSSGQGGTGNVGITFQDGSFQNTAYLSTNVVNSLTAGAGISLSSNTGNITVTNTGVLGIVGTTNQISITGNVGNVVTLGTPQDIGTLSNVQFYSLTVQNLSVLGNISNVAPTIVDGPIIYVANTATTYNDINNSGLSTGNVANNFYASILYQTSSNTWKMNIGNATGITTGNVYGNSGLFEDSVHVGNAASGGYDFPNALLQGDINLDSYGQYVLRNHSQTANASSDIVAVANNGDDSSYYIDMGINSNVYANVDYAITGFNDGYLYVNGGNLVIGTQTAAKVINFFTGGTDNTNKIRGTLSDTGLSMVGNVTANNMISTNATIGGTVSAAGNVTGGNLLTGGTVSATANIIGLNVNTGIVSATGNIRGGNLNTTGLVSTSGNIQAGNLLTSGLISSTGNINAANIAAGNITSAIISATGNITGPNIVATILSVSTLMSVSGNIQGGNFLTDGLISTTGNITGNYFLGNGRSITGVQLTSIANGTSQVNIPVASSNANITIGATSNVAVFATTGAYVTGVISATGNVTGSYFLGNGSQLTGLNAYGNVYANGTAVLATTGSSSLTITPGNNQVITGNNTSKLVTIAVNDNPTFANLSVTGNITVFGNIFANSTTYLANVGNILFSNTAPLPTANPGVMEYDGKVLYFTPQDQERGVIPAQQWYVLNADRSLTFATTAAQSLFGVGAHVSNSTRYHFRFKATVSRAAGTNNTAFTLGWRGTATLARISFTVISSVGAAVTPAATFLYENILVANFTDQLTVTSTNSPPDSTDLVVTGVIDVGAAGVGYVDPYFSWTGAAAAGAVTVSALSNFEIYPLGVTGANTNVGNWA